MKGNFEEIPFLTENTTSYSSAFFWNVGGVWCFLFEPFFNLISYFFNLKAVIAAKHKTTISHHFMALMHVPLLLLSFSCVAHWRVSFIKGFYKKIYYYYYIYNKGAFVNDLSQVRLLVRIYTQTDYQTSYSSFPKLVRLQHKSGQRKTIEQYVCLIFREHINPAQSNTWGNSTPITCCLWSNYSAY